MFHERRGRKKRRMGEGRKEEREEEGKDFEDRSQIGSEQYFYFFFKFIFILF